MKILIKSLTMIADVSILILGCDVKLDAGRQSERFCIESAKHNALCYESKSAFHHSALSTKRAQERGKARLDF